MTKRTAHRREVETDTREVTPLAFRAEFDRRSINEESRTVELVWSTGARVLRRSWIDGPFMEELSLDPKHVRLGRLNGGAPLLDTHNDYTTEAVLGVVEIARVDGKSGTATVRFARAEDSEEADKVFRKVKDGILRNTSVGYRVYKFEKTEGADGKVPVMRAIDWEPFEISVVPVGADDGAGFRSENTERNDCEIVTRAGQMENDMATKKSTAAPEIVDPESTEEVAVVPPAATVATGSDDEVRKAAVAAERTRGAGIRKSVRALKLDEKLADELIASDLSLDQARARIIDAAAEKGGEVEIDNKVRVDVKTDEFDKYIRGASDWLIVKAGLGDLVRTYQKDVKLEPGEFRGLTLFDLARESLERAGVKTRGRDKMWIVGEALIRANGMTQGTADFPVLLENTMHKTLQASYMTQADTWSAWCGRGSVSDFRAHNRYRMGSFSRLDKVAENGEFRNKSIPDTEKASVLIDTYGNIINLSRQAIINDDMDAFSRLARMIGRAAKLSIEMDVYALLLLNGGLGPTQADSQPLFHSNRGNVGTAAAISAASVDADAALMSRQMDPSGNEYLDLQPSVLLVARELKGTANTINEAQYDPDTANKLQKPNQSRGLYSRVVATPRLSGTRRYAFADPTVAPVIEVSFLDGNDTPFLDTQDGWRTDGVEMKVRLDYGVGDVDYRGATTNAGTP